MQMKPSKRVWYFPRFIFLVCFFFLSAWGVQANLMAQNHDGVKADGEAAPTAQMQRFLQDQQGPIASEALTAVPCVGGMADIYPCENVDLLAHIPLATMGGATRGNDSWGWTDPLDGKEYALMGLNNGTAFVDISDPENPIYLGRLPTHTSNSTWRDIKVYANYAFVVSEASGHGMQVFDLTELRSVVSPPVTFSNSAHYSAFGNAHNIAINEDSGYAYAVGTGTCSGGLHMVNIQNPLSPSNAGCFSADGYTHDTQCVIYDGPDANYQGDEICFSSNEDTLTIADVTNKAAPVQLSRTPYPNSGYTHQGWLTEDHHYFLLDDELDEMGNGHNTRTYIWDVSDLEAPVLMDYYDAETEAIDHNLYIKGDYAFQANYRSGLRILDISDVANAELMEVAFFDTYPDDDNPSFDGAWSNYPYFDSGVVVISDINRGLFLVRPYLAGFSLSVMPISLNVCQGADALYTVTVAENGAVDPVTLTAVGVPVGASHNFSVNPVTPTGTSDLTITNTAVVAPGSYDIGVVGSNLTDTLTTTITLIVSGGIPGVPTLVEPPDGAADVLPTPTFEWSGDGVSYYLEVADDASFTNVIYDVTVAGISHSSALVLDPLTTYYWRVTASNACGTGATSGVFSFTTRDIPPILLVDDDDNSPDVRDYYTDALDNLGAQYDVWETGSADVEPTAAELAPYETVIWFSGDRFGTAGSGPAGPSAATEAALGGWLDAGGCFFISSQDYRYDKGITSFMTNYLGVNTITNDNGDYTSVTGQGSVFGAAGTHNLTYPFEDYSDPITPNASAEMAFLGNNSNGAAINKDGGDYRNTFWPFPWEAINTSAGRESTLQIFLDWCGGLVSYGVNLTPNSQSASAAGGETVTYTLNIENSGNVSDTFDISVAGQVWPTVVSTDTIWLDAGDSSSFEVAVSIPAGAGGEQSDTAVVTATSQADPSESDSASLTTTVTMVAGVDVTAAAAALSGAPGTMVTYTMHITNTGNISDAFTLTLSGGDWEGHVEPASVTLNAGEGTAVIAVIHIAGDAGDGDTDTATVTAVSDNDAGVMAAVEVTTTAVVGDSSYSIFLPVVMRPGGQD